MPGWDCRCARCGREWTSRCKCPSYDDVPRNPEAPPHLIGCSPPPRCPGCGAKNWLLPAGPRGLAAQTPERRAEIARDGGLAGGPARAAALSRTKRRRIARAGGKAAAGSRRQH